MKKILFDPPGDGEWTPIDSLQLMLTGVQALAEHHAEHYAAEFGQTSATRRACPHWPICKYAHVISGSMLADMPPELRAALTALAAHGQTLLDTQIQFGSNLHCHLTGLEPEETDPIHMVEVLDGVEAAVALVAAQFKSLLFKARREAEAIERADRAHREGRATMDRLGRLILRGRSHPDA